MAQAQIEQALVVTVEPVFGGYGLAMVCYPRNRDHRTFLNGTGADQVGAGRSPVSGSLKPPPAPQTTTPAH